jgi:predicted DsbA family dithiol-disulfide isomerase
VSYAETIGLDIDCFRNDLKKRVYQENVREDFRRGVQNGVYTPPALFLDGVNDHEIWGLRRTLKRFPNARALPVSGAARDGGGRR